VAFVALGWTFFGLGAIGVFLPVLPTTPFMLAALWAFARGSPRFHGWLYNHRLFGPPLQRWERHRVIPAHAKALAVVAMLASLAYMAWFTDAHDFAVAAAALFMAAALCYILPKPSRVPERSGEGP